MAKAALNVTNIELVDNEDREPTEDAEGIPGVAVTVLVNVGNKGEKVVLPEVVCVPPPNIDPELDGEITEEEVELSDEPTQAPLVAVPCKKSEEKEPTADKVGLPVLPGDRDMVLQDVCERLESALCVGERNDVNEPDAVENNCGEIVLPTKGDGVLDSLLITPREGEPEFERVKSNGDNVCDNVVAEEPEAEPEVEINIDVDTVAEGEKREPITLCVLVKVTTMDDVGGKREALKNEL